ncbi:unnamed protein product [Oncorhynchus mykiss]|uniref:Tc1-like transposase DDE domain-containing protein n=1 Tax=Oncorhynchus mykiss TaxID=8022 RepID=A0A060YJ91_ONCMY|nr:unnamed protein product [Oncorhynchus mykiss]
MTAAWSHGVYTCVLLLVQMNVVPSGVWKLLPSMNQTCGGTGALHKIDGIMREENYVDILKQHLKTSVRKLKLGRKWVFQMDNDPKHTSKVVAKWLKDNKVQVLEVAITKP